MLRGHVDLISPQLVSGWAIDDSNLDLQVDISIFLDGRKIAQLRCAHYRPDLKEKGGFGDGRHGFRFEPKAPIPTDRPTRVTVRHATTGALLGGGDVMLPEGTALRPADLNVDVPNEHLALPAPSQTRELMELFALYDTHAGLFNLLSQVEFADRSAQEIRYAVLGGGKQPQPAEWGESHARDLMNNLLLSPEFQQNILRLFLEAFPEKRRLLFVHIPKCAGSDLSSHLVRRYPSIFEQLRTPHWTGREALFQGLSELVRRLRYSDAVFVRGHINLADYLQQKLARPCDRLFTILRDPVEIAISQVNYILTRLRSDAVAGSFAPDTSEWLRLLQVQVAPGEVDDSFLRELGQRALRVQEIVRPNSMCHWLGGGDAAAVLERLEMCGVEVTNTREYGRWLQERWGIESRTRQNESVKFLKREGLSVEDLGYLRELGEQDAKLYAAVERELLRSETCSMSQGAPSREQRIAAAA